LRVGAQESVDVSIEALSSKTNIRNPRLASLDAFRGLTVAAMLLVNNPGTWSAIYAPLRHAPWHGWTLADLVFPFFLFVVGVTTELAPKSPVRILRRSAIIVLLGLFLQAFPWFDLSTLRWAGVLQRIGVVYLLTAFVALALTKRSEPAQRGEASRIPIAMVIAVILLGYWFVLSRGPYAPPEATFAAQVDRLLIPEAHMWKQAKTWDPEGPLSTIPAVATALLGVLAAPLVRRRNVKMLTIWGIAGAVAGWGWGQVFPVNKTLWTSSYVLLTAGLACVLLALFVETIDVRAGWKARPLVTFGINPMAAFVGTGLMARLLGIVKIEGVSLHAWSYRTLFKPYFPAELASLLWSLCFVLVWYAILRLMQWRGIVLRV
jgi:predicted acyltransferase